MPCPYQGSDDNALAFLCAAFELPAPDSKSTRNAIDDAVVAAAVELEYQGSDRNYIDALWDLLDAGGEPLVYLWGGDIDDALILPGTDGLLSVSLDGLTATHELSGAGPHTKSAVPAGLDGDTANYLATSASGQVVFDLSLPAATAAVEAPYSVLLYLANMAESGLMLYLTVTCQADGKYSVSSSVPALGSLITDQVAAPQQVKALIDHNAGTFSVLLDDVEIIAATAYALERIQPCATVLERVDLLTGVGSEISVTLSHTLPVVAA